MRGQAVPGRLLTPLYENFHRSIFSNWVTQAISEALRLPPKIFMDSGHMGKTSIPRPLPRWHVVFPVNLKLRGGVCQEAEPGQPGQGGQRAGEGRIRQVRGGQTPDSCRAPPGCCHPPPLPCAINQPEDGIPNFNPLFFQSLQFLPRLSSRPLYLSSSRSRAPKLSLQQRAHLVLEPLLLTRTLIPLLPHTRGG